MALKRFFILRHRVVTSVRATTGQCPSFCFQCAKSSKQEVGAESDYKGGRLETLSRCGGFVLGKPELTWS